MADTYEMMFISQKDLIEMLGKAYECGWKGFLELKESTVNQIIQEYNDKKESAEKPIKIETPNWSIDPTTLQITQNPPTEHTITIGGSSITMDNMHSGVVVQVPHVHHTQDNLSFWYSNQSDYHYASSDPQI